MSGALDELFIPQKKTTEQIQKGIMVAQKPNEYLCYA